MKSILKLTLATSVALVMATGCSESNGSSTSNVTPPPPISKSGKLIDGYLAGSLVFADCNADLTFQSTGEPSTITDADGDFTLSVPNSCANATLIATGGFNVETNLPFSGMLMAPSGSKNITPLTTLVAVDSSFATTLAALGLDPIDTDYTSTAVPLSPIPADVLRLSMQVASAINIVSINTKVTDTSLIFDSILKPLATSLVDANLSDSNATKNILANAATESFIALGENPDLDITVNQAKISDINSSVLDALKVVNITITGSLPVVLTPTDSQAIDTAVETSTTEIAANVTLPIVKITAFLINGTLIPVSSVPNTYITNTTEGDINQSITALVTVDASIVKDYTVELTLGVVDKHSARTANVVVSNILMKTALAPSDTVSVPTQDLTLTVTGTDSSGAVFTAVQLVGNSDQILTTSGYSLELHMDTLLAQVNSQAAANHPLSSFFIPGEYLVTVTATGGLPMEYLNYILDITIQ